MPGAMGAIVRMATENDDQPADFDRLARRYLDLWQSQLAGLAADQALTEQIARLFAAANAQVAAALRPQCQAVLEASAWNIFRAWDPARCRFTWARR